MALKMTAFWEHMCRSEDQTSRHTKHIINSMLSRRAAVVMQRGAVTGSPAKVG